MRAKLDENVPVEAAELLRAAGWDCETIYDEGLAGADDPKVAAVICGFSNTHTMFAPTPGEKGSAACTERASVLIRASNEGFCGATSNGCRTRLIAK